jgi:hypothetical protein
MYLGAFVIIATQSIALFAKVRGELRLTVKKSVLSARSLNNKIPGSKLP